MHAPDFLIADAPLAPRTTLAVGGHAAWLAPCADEGAARAALAFAATRGLPVAVLGGGSNTLVPDEGFPGLVLSPELKGVQVAAAGAGRVVLTVGAGEDWDGLVTRAVGEGWAGLECLAGIPGRVGAAPIQNIGAYGQEVADVCQAVQVLDRRDGQVRWIPAAACGFGYRHSRFKADPEGALVLAVRLELVPGGAPTVRYPQLAEALPAGADLAQARAAVLALRRSKSMVYDPADPNHRSAGSFFVNPVVADAHADRVAARVQALGLGARLPRWPAGEGQSKLSAAWLIERAGFERGVGEGPVGLSTQHTLAVVNRGGARAGQVLRFARRIQAGVQRAFDVALEMEPRILGRG
ncbi:MAG: UDP-N-acetylmuramate dehydrogenase [Myxococcales bacterium]|nr:UDP-N-acetylmuramate dehydrogenase [Myxococcales bacterium]MCB9526694.1 UDP-N-acetylmuramate dehydrogenase [Myxococcales bacterium]